MGKKHHGYYSIKTKQQYCKRCSNVLPDRSTFGLVRCEFCGKINKKQTSDYYSYHQEITDFDKPIYQPVKPVSTKTTKDLLGVLLVFFVVAGMIYFIFMFTNIGSNLDLTPDDNTILTDDVSIQNVYYFSSYYNGKNVIFKARISDVDIINENYYWADNYALVQIDDRSGQTASFYVDRDTYFSLYSYMILSQNDEYYWTLYFSYDAQDAVKSYNFELVDYVKI